MMVTGTNVPSGAQITAATLASGTSGVAGSTYNLTFNVTTTTAALSATALTLAIPTGQAMGWNVYCPLNVSVQHFRMLMTSTLTQNLPADICDFRVGIWNASTKAIIATSQNLISFATPQSINDERVGSTKRLE
jgi:hypothetical protein